MATTGCIAVAGGAMNVRHRSGQITRFKSQTWSRIPAGLIHFGLQNRAGRRSRRQEQAATPGIAPFYRIAHGRYRSWAPAPPRPAAWSRFSPFPLACRGPTGPRWRSGTEQDPEKACPCEGGVADFSDKIVRPDKCLKPTPDEPGARAFMNSMMDSDLDKLIRTMGRTGQGPGMPDYGLCNPRRY
jgi:hypothetical protein